MHGAWGLSEPRHEGLNMTLGGTCAQLHRQRELAANSE